MSLFGRPALHDGSLLALAPSRALDGSPYATNRTFDDTASHVAALGLVLQGISGERPDESAFRVRRVGRRQMSGDVSWGSGSFEYAKTRSGRTDLCWSRRAPQSFEASGVDVAAPSEKSR